MPRVWASLVCLLVSTQLGKLHRGYIEHIEEPYIKATIITDANYIGPIMTLCLDKRGELIKQEFSGREIYYHFNSKKLKEVDKWLAPFRAQMENRFNQLDQLLKNQKNKR